MLTSFDLGVRQAASTGRARCKVHFSHVSLSYILASFRYRTGSEPPSSDHARLAAISAGQGRSCDALNPAHDTVRCHLLNVVPVAARPGQIAINTHRATIAGNIIGRHKVLPS